VKALSGTPTAAPAAAAAVAEPEPPSNDVPMHPALTELQDRAAVAQRSATLASTRSRANPELTLATTRDRGAAGERYGQTVTLAVRIPFGGGPRHDAKVATARAEAAEAEAQLALDRARVQSERDAAVARVDAARTQLAAAERRAGLAHETRGFFEKSFRLGETDLPTRLRIEAEATEAERQAARSRIELAAAISAWRQALGLLPQ
jgi:cobalt-zinc-cadmium efflux system outer membrane protein